MRRWLCGDMRRLAYESEFDAVVATTSSADSASAWLFRHPYRVSRCRGVPTSNGVVNTW
jgi:hypothetical protein